MKKSEVINKKPDAENAELDAAKEAMTDPVDVEYVASICHNVNRAYCQSLGDNSQLPWDGAKESQRENCIDGVLFLIHNPDASLDALHNNWMRVKLDDGWFFGHTKNTKIKSHPCLVPFFELPAAQQSKDYIFHAIVRSMT